MSTHDFVAIGVGPFNLGLACLTAPLPDLDGVFLEAREEFAWHPGMLLEGATIQVPFMADLVTMADPTSEFSFLNYLKRQGRLYSFYIRGGFYPLRAEYDDYCRWAAARVPGIRFGRRVERVEHDAARDGYVVHVRHTATGAAEVVRGRRLVVGVGTVPNVPAAARDLPGPAIHSADYLTHKAALQARDTITIIGSGQSAAEIYLDLLEDIHERGYRLDWITRSPRFFPMEYTKLTLELTSPEYVTYFHGLPPGHRDALIREQRSLYKGISGDLVDTIFDTLYRKRLHGALRSTLLTGTELVGASWDGQRQEYELRWLQQEQRRPFVTTTQGLVLATGYHAQVPGFLDPVRDRIRWDDRGRYDVARGYTIDHDDREIFVQNAEEHTHGLAAPDLGMGAYRNAVLIAAMAGREVYPVERRIAFQDFGVPPSSGPAGPPAPSVGARPAPGAPATGPGVDPVGPAPVGVWR